MLTIQKVTSIRQGLDWTLRWALNLMLHLTQHWDVRVVALPVVGLK